MLYFKIISILQNIFFSNFVKILSSHRIEFVNFKYTRKSLMKKKNAICDMTRLIFNPDGGGGGVLPYKG